LDADNFAYLSGIRINVVASNGRRTRGLLPQCRENLDRRALSRTVRTEEPKELALAHTSSYDLLHYAYMRL